MLACVPLSCSSTSIGAVLPSGIGPNGYELGVKRGGKHIFLRFRWPDLILDSARQHRLLNKCISHHDAMVSYPRMVAINRVIEELKGPTSRNVYSTVTIALREKVIRL